MVNSTMSFNSLLLRIRQPPRYTRTDTLFPYATLFQSAGGMGATVIEKHITLEKKMPGPDHSCSADPSEFAHLVASLREDQTTLGSGDKVPRSEEHTFEFQSLMRISYAVFCLKIKTRKAA